MNEIIVKLNETINYIERNTTLFYQNKIDEGYKELDKTLQVVSIAIDAVLSHNIRQEYEIELTTILRNAMEALEEKDVSLLADIFQYELKEKFMEIKESLI